MKITSLIRPMSGLALLATLTLAGPASAQVILSAEHESAFAVEASEEVQDVVLSRYFRDLSRQRNLLRFQPRTMGANEEPMAVFTLQGVPPGMMDGISYTAEIPAAEANNPHLSYFYVGRSGGIAGFFDRAGPFVVDPINPWHAIDVLDAMFSRGPGEHHTRELRIPGDVIDLENADFDEEGLNLFIPGRASELGVSPELVEELLNQALESAFSRVTAHYVGN